MPAKISSIEAKQQNVAKISNVVQTFEANLSGVAKLVSFDREVIAFALQGVQALHDKLRGFGYENPALNAQNTLTSLQNIRNNNSLLPRYQVIFNQAIVLLVSYFGSAVEDLFKIGVSARLLLDDDSSALMREELRLSFKGVRERGWKLDDIAADLLVDTKDLSFQDMKSIAKAFDEYVGVSIERDRVVNNIIAAQACRHVIVHAGHEVTPRMLNQLRDATPRDLKQDLEVGEVVQFTPTEVEATGASMKAYIARLAKALAERV